MDIFSYQPDSDILIEFFNSNAVIKAICGAPGSGKSVAWVAEIFYNCMRQEADSKGNRKVKFGIIRKTFRRLSTTTRSTVVQWIPEELGRVTKTAPMVGDIEFPHPSQDGTTCHIHLDFMALESLTDLENLDSYECTGCVVNELSEHESFILPKLSERIGRYPPPKDGARCTEPVILCDFNPQAESHWLYRAFVKGELKLEGVGSSSGIRQRPLMEYFEQPPAVFCDNFEAADARKEAPILRVNPHADNIRNVGVDYYVTQIDVRLAAGEWDKICTRYMMMWRSVVRGKLCHPEFDKAHHVSTHPLTPIVGDDVLIGFDTSGIHPAAVIGQAAGSQLRIFLCLYGGEQGLDDFIDQILLPTLRAMFPDSRYLAICDPANARDSRTAVSPTTLLADKYHITSITPGSNSFNVRKAAVSSVLRPLHGCIIDGSRATTGVVVNKVFIESITTTYIHKLVSGVTDHAGKPVYENKPASKDDTVHVIDAFQYLCMYHAGQMREHAIEDSQPAVKVRRVRKV